LAAAASLALASSRWPSTVVVLPTPAALPAIAAAPIATGPPESGPLTCRPLPPPPAKLKKRKHPQTPTPTTATHTHTHRVADWFAQLNAKMGGDLKKIQTVGRYMIEVWQACGMDLSRVEFIYSSEEINAR
jgi:hypothetical protein